MLRCVAKWVKVHHANDVRRNGQRACVLQFALSTWSGWQAACAGAGQVAAIASGRGVYVDRVAEVGARPVPARVAAGTDESFDDGYKRDEQ